MNTKEAIERIKARFDKWALDDEDMKAIQTLIPELKESEDERIRKWLIEMVEELRKANPTNAEHNGNCSEAIAYLEKQKEQKESKAIEWPNLSNCYRNCKKCMAKCFYRKEPYEEKKPAEWSEEEIRKILDDLIGGKDTYSSCITRLKSLHPSWKPSDEQLRPLEYAIDYFKKKHNDTTYLESLYNDLKKL